jgi:catechol 2,3-dioxygenase-like lactoylglutathione lyase family enzyme
MYGVWMIAFWAAVAPQTESSLPDFYRNVDRLIWVVDDLDRVVSGWRRLGFEQIREYGEIDLPGEEFRGKPAKARVKMAAGRLGSARVRWLQPVAGENAYSDFLSRHGSGIFSLVHRVPTQEVLDRETRRLAGLGVGVLERGGIDGPTGKLNYIYLDTEKQGKYVLGLVYAEGNPTELPEQLPMGLLKLSQYAFVVRDPRAVSAFWNRLGFPGFTFTHGPLRNTMYQEKAAQFDMELGWQRHGPIPYEWILPLKGPMTYQDHLRKHGEGVHHIAFDVGDIDKVTAQWKSLGLSPVMSGAWGDEGKPGSGRFSYSDADAIGGIAVEFLWNFR